MIFKAPSIDSHSQRYIGLLTGPLVQVTVHNVSLCSHCNFFRISVHFIFVLLGIISAGNMGVGFCMLSKSGHAICCVEFVLRLVFEQ